MRDTLRAFGLVLPVVLLIVIITTPTSATGGSVLESAENDVILSAGSLENQYIHRWAYRDNNLNRIDDVIERIIENRDLFEIKRRSFVLSGHRGDIKASFILNFNRPVDNDDLQQLAKLAGESNIYKFKKINAVSIRGVKPRLAENLVKLPGVEVVELQERVHSVLNVSTPAIKAGPSPDYASVWEDLGVDGTGINIAILDTGVDDEHESLSGKYVAGVDTTGPTDLEYNPNDQSDYDIFHGTHVAGIAMGTGGAAQVYRGVAPGAGLIDVRVLDSKGEGTSESVIRGIEWVIANKDKYNIRVMSLSLTSEFNSKGTDSQSQAVNRAVDAGIVVVVAAGNDGKEGYIPSPGAAYKAITVGALFDHSTINRSDDTVASYSNQGPRLDDGDSDQYDELKPDVTAPGTFITSAKGSNGTATDSYHSLSGTSMATPHVTGVVALMLQANPDLTPEEVKAILRDTAETRGLPYDPSLSDKYNTGFGWGIVDAYAAVQRAMGLAGNPDFSVDNISFSDNTPVVGQRVLITAEARNQGNVDGTCDVAFYTKQDELFVPIGSVRGISIKPGGTAFAKLAVAAQIEGDYAVKVVVENGTPSENNTANNETVTSINVGPPPTAPDLTLMEFDIFFKGKLRKSFFTVPPIAQTTIPSVSMPPLWGKPLTVGISAKIHNVGLTDATAGVSFYVDQKVPDNLIASFDGVLVRAQGESILSTTWSVPSDLQGEHTLWVVVENYSPGDDDPNNNEANRSRSLPTKMTVGDVAVSDDDISFSDNEPSEGEKVDVEVTVHNTGVIDLENVKVTLYIDNVPFALGTVSLIEQNSENSVVVEWSAMRGDHEIGVYASVEGVQESNYGNNTAAAFISVRQSIIPWVIILSIMFLSIAGAAAVVVWRHK